jgi:DNA polymerase-3 subunit delta'
VSFKEIKGQKEPLDFLRAAVRSNRVAHAYLFSGPEGVGKATAARALAALWLCQESAGDEPCGVCASCGKIRSGSHADVQWLCPEDGVIKIDAVRDACRSLSLKGFESLKKVLIVDGAQYLNGPSANAMLKTLEEPSGQAVIILITDSLKSVLPTIASRCQRVIFRALGVDLIAAALMERCGLSRQESMICAQMSQGSLGCAVRYHEGGLIARRDSLIRDLMSLADPSKRFLLPPGRDRHEKQAYLTQALRILASWYRDILVAKYSDDPRLLVNADRRDDILVIGDRMSAQALERKLSALAQAAEEFEQNANINLSLTKLKAELWKT